MEEQYYQQRKEKPHSTQIIECMRKETRSEGENKLIVSIPMIARIRPIVVEPQTIVIAFNIEDMLIAIGTSSVSHDVPPLPPPAYLGKRSGCILCVIENHQAHHTKSFFFV